jgi:hypothetical protein
LDIAEVATWISAGKDLLLGLSALAAAIFAYLGVSAWKKELKGKAEYQLAKNVLKAVYRVREAFKHVRNPAIYQYEYPDEMRDHHGQLKREKNYEGTAHVYEKRWEKMAEAFGALEELHLDAQVEWGAEFQNKIVKLRSCRIELMIAMQKMLEQKKYPTPSPVTPREQKAEEFSILYHIGEDSKHDRFTPKINGAIKEFEVWLRPYVKHKG